MNLKLNNEPRDAVRLKPKKASSSIKEERRRTGRYIAILVGISLLLLAIYHAWVRRIPVVASLVVPALIMFIYVAWVLYSASRDKYRALDLEAALRATDVTGPEDISPASPTNNIEISIISEDVVNRNDDPPKLPEAIKQNAKPPQVVLNTKLGQNLAELTSNGQLVKPIILVNDKPPDDLEGTVVDMTKIAILQERNIVLSEKIRAKRRFFTNKRRNVYKRSYSIA